MQSFTRLLYVYVLKRFDINVSLSSVAARGTQNRQRLANRLKMHRFVQQGNHCSSLMVLFHANLPHFGVSNSRQQLLVWRLFIIITIHVVDIVIIDVVVHVLRVYRVECLLLFANVLLHKIQVDVRITPLQILCIVVLVLFALNLLIIVVFVVFWSDIVQEISARPLLCLTFGLGLLIFSRFFLIIVVIIIVIVDGSGLSILYRIKLGDALTCFLSLLLIPIVDF